MKNSLINDTITYKYIDSFENRLDSIQSIINSIDEKIVIHENSFNTFMLAQVVGYVLVIFILTFIIYFMRKKNFMRITDEHEDYISRRIEEELRLKVDNIIENQIANFTKILIELQSSVKEINKKLESDSSTNNTSIENKSENPIKSNSENQINSKISYYNGYGRNGFDINNFKTIPDIKSIFKVLEVDQNNAIFEVSDNPDTQKIAIENFSTILESICEYTELPRPGLHTKIISQHGTLVKTGNYWVIKDKVKVSFE